MRNGKASWRVLEIVSSICEFDWGQWDGECTVRHKHVALKESAGNVWSVHSKVRKLVLRYYVGYWILSTNCRLSDSLVGGSDNGQWELELLVRVILLVTFTDNINNCDERDKSSFWSRCNEFALGIVMIILFYKIK